MDIFTETSLETTSQDPAMWDQIASQWSVFGTRAVGDYGVADNYNRCPVRVRLTPSNPNKVGAMWFTNPLPVALGFDTSFTFQITDPSTVCTIHRDTSFSVIHHKSCSAHGGDGFAFVIQASKRGNEALGEAASQMG